MEMLGTEKKPRWYKPTVDAIPPVFVLSPDSVIALILDSPSPRQEPTCLSRGMDSSSHLRV